MKKVAWIAGLVLVVILSAIIYYRYYYVFGEGVKSGQLNYLVRKGNIFKTNEGKLIQNGLRSGAPGSVQSYEFKFSVSDARIADILMKNSGKDFDLHYKEYHHTLPWRGFTEFIVDSIYAMRASPAGPNLPSR
ncbi:hypothetical protein [Hufsiella ginkgonis]|uniref:6-phosphogluconate dehydrogenase n=1 Tax=Hufsiella ginkgonis TaxID=2695274 RepID=A0A7K1Y0D9_9SPHI|nr:hypothetical protein [Hufsiella ginkgonis]MXV16662.1 hypothetical protein [Hufsiella ginkgonis]